MAWLKSYKVGGRSCSEEYAMLLPICVLFAVVKIAFCARKLLAQVFMGASAASPARFLQPLLGHYGLCMGAL